MSNRYYKHIDLDPKQPDSIRLLVIEPDRPGSLIRCRLIHTRLRECRMDIYHSYTALSYVWGNPNATRYIIVNGQVLPIAANLAEALNDLRDAEAPLRLWVDAICINQRSKLERGHQVGLMKEIYGIAHHTLIYLGSCTIRARDLFRDMVQHFNQDLKIKLSKESFVAARDILSHTWFTRVWVYQELVLAKEVFVQIGRTRLPWNFFHKFLLPVSMEEDRNDDKKYSVVSRLGNSSASYAEPIELEEDGSNYLKLLPTMNEARLKYQRSLVGVGNPASLMSILDSRRGAGVSDPKDIIYGHLAVAGLASSIGNISIDYTKSVNDVFVDAARYITIVSYEAPRPLLLLGELFYQCEAKYPSLRRKNLPSWVPDWAVPKAHLPNIRWLDIGHNNQFEHPTSNSEYPMFLPDFRIINQEVDDKVLSFFYEGYHCSGVEFVDETTRPVFLGNDWDQAIQSANDLIMEFWETTPWYTDISSYDQYLPITRAIKLAWRELGAADIFGPFLYGWKIKNDEYTELKCLLKLFHSKKIEPTKTEFWKQMAKQKNLFTALPLMSIFKMTNQILANSTLARFSSGCMGVVPTSTKRGDFIIRLRERYSSDQPACCMVFRPMLGRRDSHFDGKVLSTVISYNHSNRNYRGIYADTIHHGTYIGQGWIDGMAHLQTGCHDRCKGYSLTTTLINVH